MASSGVILGSDSTCFMLRLMMQANLYVFSNSSILFHRRVLMRTVMLLGVRSIIAVIFKCFMVSVAKIYLFEETTKFIHFFII